MHLIAGLGNPSLRYRHTRHNVGFDAIDVIAKQYGISVRKKEYFALTGTGRIAGKEVMLIKPQTFMNRSGESIASVLKSKGIDIGGLIVLVDDIMLESGTIRIREQGSAGGHNGLKSIISTCGSQEFARIRIGVGLMPQGADQIKFVLSRPVRDDKKKIEQALLDVSQAVSFMVSEEVQKAMNTFNGKKASLH